MILGALVAVAQHAPATSSRVCISINTLLAPSLSALGDMDLYGSVASVKRTETFYEGDVTHSATVIYSFDENGNTTSRLEQEADGTSSLTTFTNIYRNGRLYQVEVDGGLPTCRSITYRYDLNGNVIGCVNTCDTLPQLTTTTIFDRFRNPLSQKDHINNIECTFDYQYHPAHAGQVVSRTLLRRDVALDETVHFTTIYEYDDHNLLTSETTRGGDGPEVLTHYAYNAEGMLVSKSTVSGEETRVETYKRDEMGSCLWHEVRVNGRLVAQVESEITYDTPVVMK